MKAGGDEYGSFKQKACETFQPLLNNSPRATIHQNLSILRRKVSARLIDQMGGLQGCRVFKIAGVRSLIKKYSPSASFERTEAVTMIGDNDPATHVPRFDPYKRLYIEPRDKTHLKPEDAFLYLLKKGVFRAGLKLACPTCQLDFWVTLDDAKSTTQCPYCGIEFMSCHSSATGTGPIAAQGSSAARRISGVAFPCP
jgi:hypothetical protein